MNLNAVLRTLSSKNHFNYRKIEPHEIPNDKPQFDMPLAEFIQSQLSAKMNQNNFIFKLHYLVNLEPFNITQLGCSKYSNKIFAKKNFADNFLAKKSLEK